MGEIHASQRGYSPESMEQLLVCAGYELESVVWLQLK
jgi:hypothetical protein